MEQEMDEMLTILDGNILSYDKCDVGFTHRKSTYFNQTLLDASATIKNVRMDSGKIYEIIFMAYYVCDDDESMVGIHSITIKENDKEIYSIWNGK